MLDDELEVLSEDDDYLSIASSRVKISSDSAIADEEAPLFEEDVEEQAVTEVISSGSGKLEIHELSNERVNRYDEISDYAFKVGDRVIHPVYGEGELTGQFGEGELYKVFITFDQTASGENRTRLFLSSFLQLEKAKKTRKVKK